MAKILYYAPYISCEDPDGRLTTYLSNEDSMTDLIEELMKELNSDFDAFAFRKRTTIIVTYGSKNIFASVDSAHRSGIDRSTTASFTVTVSDTNTKAFGITHIIAIRIDE